MMKSWSLPLSLSLFLFIIHYFSFFLPLYPSFIQISDKDKTEYQSHSYGSKTEIYAVVHPNASLFPTRSYFGNSDSDFSIVIPIPISRS